MPYILLIILLIVVAFYAVWILGILFLRLVGFLIGLAIVAAAFTFIAGLVWGVVLPLRVLRGRSTQQVTIASPQLVREGLVLKGLPRGASKDFGWDPAWPLYVPYQLRFDAAAVRGETKHVVSAIRSRSGGWLPNWTLILGIPVYGLILGLFSGVLLWTIIVKIFQLLVTLAQSITTRFTTIRESRYMREHAMSVRCTRCYRETGMPSYICPNPECPRIHRDVNPGPLGIRSRICECEAQLPLTVAAASQVLTALCPHCEAELPQGTGSRRVIVAPIFGSVGSGKTQFLATTAAALQRWQDDPDNPIQLTALTPAASQFLTASVKESAAGRSPLKTQHHDRPEGFPFLVSGHGSDFELHLMDAAGENFVHSDDSRSLAYLDISNTLLFLIDPLSVPEVREQLTLSGAQDGVQIAQGQANDAYGSVVDRLRDSGEDLRKKKLAVVVTKADVIGRIFSSDPMPCDSVGVRAWLYSHGNDNLVRRIETDFSNVEYFSADSTTGTAPNSAFHPLRVINRLITDGGETSLFGTVESSADDDSAAGTLAMKSADGFNKESVR